MRFCIWKTLSSAAVMIALGFAVNTSTTRGSLVAYYPLDGNLNDTSGNGKNGAVATQGSGAGLTFGASGSGHTGAAGDQGIVENGTDTNQYFTSPVNVSPAAMPQVTFGGWFKASDITASSNRVLIADDTGGFGREIDIDTRPTAGHGYAAFNGGSSTPASPVGSGIKPTGSSYDFVAVTYDNSGGGTAMLDVNGTFFSATGNQPAGNNFLTIGRSLGNDFPFAGTIDDVFIYNTALSQAALNDIQQNGVTTPEPATCGLLALAAIGALARRRRSGAGIR